MAPSILNEKFELTILSNLIYNEEFARKAVPFLKEEFFRDRTEIIVFQQINNFITKYKKAFYISIDEPEARLAVGDKTCHTNHLYKKLKHSIHIFFLGCYLFHISLR